MAASEFWLSTNNAAQTCEKSSPKELANSLIVMFLCLFTFPVKIQPKAYYLICQKQNPRKLCIGQALGQRLAH